MCPRCGHQLVAHRRNGIEYAYAFAVSGLLFLVLSLLFDFLSFRASGQQNAMDLPAALLTLSDNDYTSLAIIMALGTLILPGLTLLGIAVFQHMRLFTKPSKFAANTLLWIKRLVPWSMAEIFLIGTLVSLIKITSLAEVYFGLSFYAYTAFTICFACAMLYFERADAELWLGDVEAGHEIPLSAKQANVSVQRTWALLFTATLLYVPANILPIMNTTLLGSNEPSTIVGGVRTLWESGSYPVASIIFIASIVVPVAKLFALAWLNYSVQYQHVTNQNLRAFSYRVTELIGRWSMIDVFVVAILVALIQLGNTMSIYPGPAVLAFCAVVFITMIAAMTFDSRLIWYEFDDE